RLGGGGRGTVGSAPSGRTVSVRGLPADASMIVTAWSQLWIGVVPIAVILSPGCSPARAAGAFGVAQSFSLAADEVAGTTHLTTESMVVVAFFCPRTVSSSTGSTM